MCAQGQICREKVSCEVYLSTDPPLCRESSQVNMDRAPKDVGCEGENAGKISEVGDEELVLEVSARCGKERDMTRG